MQAAGRRILRPKRDAEKCYFQSFHPFIPRRMLDIFNLFDLQTLNLKSVPRRFVKVVRAMYTVTFPSAKPLDIRNQEALLCTLGLRYSKAS